MLCYGPEILTEWKSESISNSNRGRLKKTAFDISSSGVLDLYSLVHHSDVMETFEEIKKVENKEKEEAGE